METLGSPPRKMRVQSDRNEIPMRRERVSRRAGEGRGEGYLHEASELANPILQVPPPLSSTRMGSPSYPSMLPSAKPHVPASFPSPISRPALLLVSLCWPHKVPQVPLHPPNFNIPFASWS